MPFKKLSEQDKAEAKELIHEGYAALGYACLLLRGTPPTGAAKLAHEGAAEMTKQSRLLKLL